MHEPDSGVYFKGPADFVGKLTDYAIARRELGDLNSEHEAYKELRRFYANIGALMTVDGAELMHRLGESKLRFGDKEGADQSFAEENQIRDTVESGIQEVRFVWPKEDTLYRLFPSRLQILSAKKWSTNG
eukprot:gnl/TRDRNA2_/TRDRNA2_174566_c1_seq2.p1 gnl/TRDRNA2_/TRDRNA2_174566_c1~~gnl/TRDRNA2_/TRDRNA2_174566_c1_seq2.p1  ORF type:complete len:130 (-),score=20.72 gnl/TRDRNA2_/TRDRNA2_174566_c1_seq2:326-715(-)